MPTPDQEIVDDKEKKIIFACGLKSNLRSNPPEHFGEHFKTISEEQSGQQFGGDPSQNIPETTRTSSRNSRSKRRVRKKI